MSDETLDIEAERRQLFGLIAAALCEQEERSDDGEEWWTLSTDEVAEVCADAVADSVRLLRTQRDEAAAERDAYKRAKAENDDRFMIERDQARTERDGLAAQLDAVRALCEQSARCHVQPEACDKHRLITVADLRSALAAAVPVLADDTQCVTCGLMFHGAKGYCDWCGAVPVHPANDETDKQR